MTLRVIGIGVVVGLVLAVLGGFALRKCADHNWVAATWLQTPIIALALLCFGLAQWLGGSGFISCFVGSLTFGGLTKQHKEQFLAAAEGTADALALMTWFTFGTIAIGLLLRQFSWHVVAYALLSLTVVRMLPVYVCLIRKRLQWDTQLFIGWFGPRGLASIVFAVMVMAKNLPGNDTIMATVLWTIILSVIAHGLTANWLSEIYSKRVADQQGVV